MTKSDSRRLSICRLLTLLLVLVVVGTSCNQVNGASLRDSLHQLNWANVLNHSVGSDPVGSTQVRIHFLSNHCSNRYVQVLKLNRQGVDARGTNNSETDMAFSTVIFKPTPRGTIVMQGLDSHYYICISRSGRPRTRAKPLPRDCEFHEEYAADGSSSKRYRLANNIKTIYLGFNKRGKPLKGTKFYNKKRQNCFTFTKLPTHREGDAKCSGPIQGVNYCDINLYNNMITTTSNKRKQKKTKARKLRHSRHHKKSRKNGR